MEALSVTPFAERAIDRGLTGVLVALVRNLERAYNGNLRAQEFDRHGKSADHVVMFLKRRSEAAADNNIRQLVEDEIAARLDLWARERAVPARRVDGIDPPGLVCLRLPGQLAAGGEPVTQPQQLRVGMLRPNQLLHTYGIGSVADLPSLSVMTLGLDHWHRNRPQPVTALGRRSAYVEVTGGWR